MVTVLVGRTRELTEASHEQHRQKRVCVSLASLMLADKEVPYLEGPEDAGSATEAVELFLLLFLSLLSFAPFLLS